MALKSIFLRFIRFLFLPGVSFVSSPGTFFDSLLSDFMPIPDAHFFALLRNESIINIFHFKEFSFFKRLAFLPSTPVMTWKAMTLLLALLTITVAEDVEEDEFSKTSISKACDFDSLYFTRNI